MVSEAPGEGGRLRVLFMTTDNLHNLLSPNRVNPPRVAMSSGEYSSDER
jgi:hypothetical protein